MNILLTFTGFHDPFSKSIVADEEHPGPILSLVHAKRFSHIFLFATPKMEKNTQKTYEAILEYSPNTKVDIIPINLLDPIDYFVILKELKKHIHIIKTNFPDADFSISVSSGTPQMHACWIWLAASGEIPARIINTRPPQYVSKDKPLIYELDITSPSFPMIRMPVSPIDMQDYDCENPDLMIKNIGIIGEHPSIRKILQTSVSISSSDAPVLIFGETGTGKELFARLIHQLSKRHKEKFVPINCAAIPNELIESTLFGHKKGAFTGAYQDQIGKFIQADKGTIFLDELGEMPLSTQSKLLRVLQDKVVEPVGETKSKKVDVRIIAATNKNLPSQIKKGLFREDLYYRLNVCEIRLPSLRERRTDIPVLAINILDKINLNLKRHKRLSPLALKKLQNHKYPGNIRELENVIERTARLTNNEIIEDRDIMFSEDLYEDDIELPVMENGFQMEDYLSKIREKLISRALNETDHNQSEAARLLGISPQAVHKFLKTRKG